MGRPEAAGDVAVEAIEAIVFGQRLPGQHGEVALEDIAQEHDLVVLALEVIQELPEAVGHELLGADVQIRDDGDTHGAPSRSPEECASPAGAKP